MLTRIVTIAAMLSIIACSSKDSGNKKVTKVVEPTEVESDPEANGSVDALERPNSPPLFRAPEWKRVGVGQHIAFGVAPVDPEGDQIRVDLIDKPASAKYTPMSLTVSWTPTRADMPGGSFTVKITETNRGSGEQRTFLHTFGIEVTAKEQPKPRARPLGDVVELFLTIHDEARLAEVNKQWPIDRMLNRAGEIDWLWMTEDEKKGKVEPKAAHSYKTFLKSLAAEHKYPQLDPDSPEFDKKRFADPKMWSIITVRPRVDKGWNEIRIVYTHKTSDEPIYPMARFRIVKKGPMPQAKIDNNKIFQRLVADAFFDDKGGLIERYKRDKKAHGEAVAKLVTGVLMYKDPKIEYAKGNFHVFAHEARMGGGSLRDKDGNYAAGDGWVFGALRPQREAGRATLDMEPVRLPGFAVHMAASSDGERWDKVCGPRWDVKHADHVKGMEGACMPKLGIVGFPEEVDGKILRAHHETTHTFVEHRDVHSVATLALRDPRRELHEERGMTCVQCHTRAFGVSDYFDRAGMTPKDGVPKRMMKDVSATFFVIAPVRRWEAYTIDFQHLQECQSKKAFQLYLGRDMKLRCPLRANDSGK